MTASSNTDNKTSITTPVFAGTAEAGSTVTLLDGAKSIGTATANSLGAWTIKSSALAVGAHSISAKATDAAGNVGVASAALPVTILATHDVHWIAGSGSFDTVADWSPQRVPNSSDNAIIDAAGTYTVTAARKRNHPDPVDGQERHALGYRRHVRGDRRLGDRRTGRHDQHRRRRCAHPRRIGRELWHDQRKCCRGLLPNCK